MRATVVLLLTLLSVSPQLFASRYDWNNAEKLKRSTAVSVDLKNGSSLSGRVEAVGDWGIQLSYPWDTDAPEKVARDDIRRIVRVRHRELPDPQKWMAISTLGGAAVGGTAGAIYDATHYNNANWLKGALGGAGIGFLGSTVVLAGVGIASLAHHNKVIYEDKSSGFRPTLKPGRSASSGESLRTGIPR